MSHPVTRVCPGCVRLQRQVDAYERKHGTEAFGMDPGDSRRLLELRQAIDEHLGWRTEEEEARADYVARVRQVGEALTKAMLEGIAATWRRP